jgi:CRISPR-associated protein Csm2
MRDRRENYPFGEESDKISGELPEDLQALTADKIVEYGEKLGKEYAKHRENDKRYGVVLWKRGREEYSDIKTNQIRNVFGAIKRVEMEWTKEKKKEKPDFSRIEREVELLKPRLAYAARHEEVKPLKKVLDKAIDGVKNSNRKEKAFENFLRFVESIVAYHKFYGGED